MHYYIFLICSLHSYHTPAESETCRYSSILPFKNHCIIVYCSLGPPEVSYVDCRNCPISIIVGSVNNCPLYRKYKTLGAGDCGWCTGIRQYYPAVERFPTSFVEERLYRKFYKFLSELPRFTLCAANIDPMNCVLAVHIASSIC